jgi:hypothetical protein
VSKIVTKYAMIGEDEDRKIRFEWKGQMYEISKTSMSLERTVTRRQRVSSEREELREGVEEEKKEERVERISHETEDFIERYIEKNPYKIYGFLNPDFKIRDLYEKSMEGKTKTRGQSCLTMKLTKLVYLLYRFRDALERPEEGRRKELLRKEKTMEEYFSYFKEGEEGREEKAAFFSVYGSFPKKKICELFFDLLSSKDLIVPAPL